jgi:hypothetical protein
MKLPTTGSDFLQGGPGEEEAFFPFSVEDHFGFSSVTGANDFSYCPHPPLVVTDSIAGPDVGGGDRGTARP